MSADKQPELGGMPQAQATPKHAGHCLHCGTLITANTSAAWHRASRSPCPRCGRPW